MSCRYPEVGEQRRPKATLFSVLAQKNHLDAQGSYINRKSKCLATRQIGGSSVPNALEPLASITFEIKKRFNVVLLGKW